MEPCNVLELRRQELSCALCRGNACMYDRSLISVARGVGRGFLPGFDRAVDDAGDVYSRPSLDCRPVVLGVLGLLSFYLVSGFASL